MVLSVPEHPVPIDAAARYVGVEAQRAMSVDLRSSWQALTRTPHVS